QLEETEPACSPLGAEVGSVTSVTSDPAMKRVRRLAVGGTAEIWLVERAGIGPCVEKRLLASAPPALKARLEREGELLSKIHAPEVVRCIARESEALVLEHVDGVDAGALFAHL